MLAVQFEHQDRRAIIKYLIEKGADVNCRGNDLVDGGTARHIAADHGHFDIVQFLITKGADPTIVDANNCFPAEVANHKLMNEQDRQRIIHYSKCHAILQERQDQIKRYDSYSMTHIVTHRIL